MWFAFILSIASLQNTLHKQDRGVDLLHRQYIFFLCLLSGQDVKRGVNRGLTVNVFGKMKRMEVYFCACAVERGADAQNTKEGPEKEEIRRKEEREREAAKRQEAVSTSSSVLLPASSDWRFSLRSSTILLERILASTAPGHCLCLVGKGPPTG